jgi:hypothetical protein
MNLAFIFISIIAASIVILLLSKFKLREKYMAIWIGLSVFVFLFGIFYKQIDSFIQYLGFKVYSNFIFLFFGICIGMLVFQLSLNISRQEDKIQTLAEEVSLLKMKILDKNK